MDIDLNRAKLIKENIGKINDYIGQGLCIEDICKIFSSNVKIKISSVHLQRGYKIATGGNILKEIDSVRKMSREIEPSIRGEHMAVTRRLRIAEIIEDYEANCYRVFLDRNYES